MPGVHRAPQSQSVYRAQRGPLPGQGRYGQVVLRERRRHRGIRPRRGVAPGAGPAGIALSGRGGRGTARPVRRRACRPTPLGREVREYLVQGAEGTVGSRSPQVGGSDPPRQSSLKPGQVRGVIGARHQPDVNGVGVKLGSLRGGAPIGQSGPRRRYRPAPTGPARRRCSPTPACGPRPAPPTDERGASTEKAMLSNAWRPPCRDGARTDDARRI